eukprot:6599348-Alexandrium_andersonii.AAC.1
MAVQCAASGQGLSSALTAHLMCARRQMCEPEEEDMCCKPLCVQAGLGCLRGSCVVECSEGGAPVRCLP